MQGKSGLPEQEARLAELRRLGVLDASAKTGLDALARAAAIALEAPIAVVSLADLGGRWLNAPLPDDFTCKPGECALGAYVAHHRQTLALTDAREDARFQDHPWVTGSPHMAGYLGAPAMIGSGYGVGALNIVDTRPRVWTAAEIATAENLARVAASLLEARSISAAMDAALDGLAVTDPEGVFTYMNAAHARQFGYFTAAELIGKSWRVLYDPEQARRIEGVAFPEVARRGAWTGELIGLKRDGSAFPQEISLSALPTGGIICATRDISHRMTTGKSELSAAAQRADARTAHGGQAD